MKSLLFIIPHLLHGGTNKSLQNILLEIDKTKYDIHIYSLFDRGVYKPLFKGFLVKRGTFIKFSFCTWYIPAVLNKLKNRKSVSILELLFIKESNRIQNQIRPDIVISFEEGLATRFGSCFTRTRKIAWVQCDFARYIKSINNERSIKVEEDIYRCFDRIVCVSKYTMLSMSSVFPRLSDRITFSYNMLNIENVRRLGQKVIDDTNYDTSLFTLLSIGRCEAVKRFDFIPSIVKNILRRRPVCKFKWYIMAPEDGSLINKIKDEINRLKLEDYIVLLGGKSNPYPYINKADLIVCLSESESWSYVINEAILLHTPVVTTDFDAAYEVVNSDTGIITKMEKIDDILYELINNIKGKYSSLKKSTKAHQFSNDIAIQQFNSILESVIS